MPEPVAAGEAALALGACSRRTTGSPRRLQLSRTIVRGRCPRFLPIESASCLELEESASVLGGGIGDFVETGHGRCTPGRGVGVEAFGARAPGPRRETGARAPRPLLRPAVRA
jgi:hypothetical protein